MGEAERVDYTRPTRTRGSVTCDWFWRTDRAAGGHGDAGRYAVLARLTELAQGPSQHAVVISAPSCPTFLATELVDPALPMAQTGRIQSYKVDCCH